MNNQRTIKWGILGTGNISRKFFGDMKFVPNSEVVAVGSRTKQSADTYAQQYNIPRAYGSYEELANDPDLDIIYVATPHPAHHENTLTCLRAGKAVLCEKPFTVNASEAEEMIHDAKQNNLFLMEAMWTRYLPAIIKVREWLAAGRIGEVRLLKAEFGFNAGWNPEGRLLNPHLGGGALLDAGIYPVSFASMVFGGAPDKIVSHAHIGETGVDEHFSAVFSYANGQSATINSAVRLGMQNDAYILGTKGHIHIPGFFSSKTATLHTEAEVETFVHKGTEHGFAFEIAEANRCLREGLLESSTMPHHETIQLMKTMDELRAQWGLKYPFEK